MCSRYIRQGINSRFLLLNLENVRLVEPLTYPAFINLLLRTQLVLTDSGGIQEEGAFLGKRILIARTETERSDGIQDGLASVVGCGADQIFSSLNQNLDTAIKTIASRKPKKCATEIIADHIEKVIV